MYQNKNFPEILKNHESRNFWEFGSESNWIGSEHFVIELVRLEDLTWRIWRSDQFPKPLSYLKCKRTPSNPTRFYAFYAWKLSFGTWIKVPNDVIDILTWPLNNHHMDQWIFTLVRKMFIKMMTHRKWLSLSERGFTIKEHCWAFSL